MAKAPDLKTFLAVEDALAVAAVAALNTANGGKTIAFVQGSTADLPTPRIGVSIPGTKPEEQRAFAGGNWYHSAYRGHLWLHIVTRRDDPPSAGPSRQALIGLIRSALIGPQSIAVAALPYHELLWLSEDSGMYQVGGDETESEPIVFEFVIGLPPKNYPAV